MATSWKFSWPRACGWRTQAARYGPAISSGLRWIPPSSPRTSPSRPTPSCCMGRSMGSSGWPKSTVCSCGNPISASPSAAMMAGRYAHAKQFKRHHRNCAGRAPGSAASFATSDARSPAGQHRKRRCRPRARQPDPPALALLLRVDLVGAREGPFQRRFDLCPAGDLASDVADDAAEPGAQQAQLPMVAFELLGVGIAPRHHRGALGDALIGLPQLHPVLLASWTIPVIAAYNSLASVGKVMFLGWTVVSTVTRLRSRVRARHWRAPPASSRPGELPACRQAASSNGSGLSVRAGTRAGKTPRQ